jgi:hypothetical protein
MPLPDSNLPTSSLPWAREVEKQLATVSNTVSINEINNSARDAASETNLNNLLGLMADQIELTTYSKELSFGANQSVSFTSGPGNFVSNTADLNININLNKARNLLINYSTYYIAQTDTINATSSSYVFSTTLFVDGVQVDFQSNGSSQLINIAGNQLVDYGSINLVKLVPVLPGIHTVSVKVEYFGSPPTGGSVLMNTSGDNLIVTVVQ